METRATIYDRISEISPADWDCCAGRTVPYVLHRHFLALENANLIGSSRGFRPRYIVLRDGTNKVIGVAASFIKFNSSGELGADFGLPLAHERLASPYYPKLVIETPFVPVEGPRLMVNSDQPREARLLLLKALMRIAKEEGAVSVQLLYGEPDDINACEELGFQSTKSITFGWIRGHVKNFEEWIATMHRRGRKRIYEEYTKPLSDGLLIQVVPGPALPSHFANWFFARYMELFARHATEPWLNIEYFKEILVTMRQNVDFIAMKRSDVLVGGGLCFVSQNKLFAHHWVSHTAGKNDIFACFYHVIKTAFDHGLDSIDFQPIGKHKSLRGIHAVPARHAMFFLVPEFGEVAGAIFSARALRVQRDIDYMNKMLPFSHLKHSS